MARKSRQPLTPNTRGEKPDPKPGPKGAVWRVAFLKALKETGANVSAACRAAGISRWVVYDLKGRDTGFRDEWDEIEESCTDELIHEARRRAFRGTLKPVFYHGKRVGRVREYSDAMLMFLIRARRPHVYRENYDVERIVREQIERAKSDPGHAGGVPPGD